MCLKTFTNVATMCCAQVLEWACAWRKYQSTPQCTNEASTVCCLSTGHPVDCPLHQVLYGMDYVSAEREAQHHYLRAALLDHLKQSGNSLLVIEVGEPANAVADVIACCW